MKGADAPNIIITEFGGWVSRAFIAARSLCGAGSISRAKASLCLGVLRVLFRRAPEQMCRIHAKTIVAMVTSEVSLGGRAVRKHQRTAMGCGLDATPVTPGDKKAVVFGSGASPQPTRIGACGAIHERQARLTTCDR